LVVYITRWISVMVKVNYNHLTMTCIDPFWHPAIWRGPSRSVNEVSFGRRASIPIRWAKT
jgi:hypothetical protein